MRFPGLFGAQIMFMIEAKIQNKCETELCGPSVRLAV